MAYVRPENVNTNPEPRIKPKLSPTIAKLPNMPRAQHIANQYQNNKAKVFHLGYFEHTE